MCVDVLVETGCPKGEVVVVVVVVVVVICIVVVVVFLVVVVECYCFLINSYCWLTWRRPPSETISK